jgi:hypothetical protein
MTREAVNHLMSESAFTRLVIKAAQMRGWRTFHTPRSMTGKGQWLTAVLGDGKGFPDLLLLREHRTIFAELKVGYKKPRPEQLSWLCALAFAGHETAVWYPKDWNEIKEILA